MFDLIQMSISSTVQNGSNPDYVNTRLEEHPWFVGEMDRDCANQKLAPYPIYTFLVKGHPLMTSIDFLIPRCLHTRRSDLGGPLAKLFPALKKLFMAAPDEKKSFSALMFFTLN
jgi:hypothetical protein